MLYRVARWLLTRLLFVLLAALAVVVLLAACAGNDSAETSEGDAQDSVQEIDVLVQAGDVDEARQRFDEPHRLLHVTASDLASDDPELSQQLDSATEELQRELLMSEVDPVAVSEVVSRLLEMLAGAE